MSTNDTPFAPALGSVTHSEPENLTKLAATLQRPTDLLRRYALRIERAAGHAAKEKG